MTRSPIAPRVRIGIVLPHDCAESARLTIPDFPYLINDVPLRATTLTARVDGESITIDPPSQSPKCRRRVDHKLSPTSDSTPDNTGITLHDALAGRGFHWSKRIDVTLPASIELSVKNGHLMIVNDLPIETYLKGVITAEMSGHAPIEFLKAQCIVARSWMRAATETKHTELDVDYCNDDCCQRFQGVGALTKSARNAVDQTAGKVIVHKSGGIIDANYSKSCGGVVEAPEHVWGISKPGLHSLVDAPHGSPIDMFNRATGRWPSACDAYCSPNTVPEADLPQYLGRVDDGGGHFRWQVRYPVEQIEDLLQRKHFTRVAHRFSGGELEQSTEFRPPQLVRLHDLVATRRGHSGRATQLKITYDDPQNTRQSTTIDDQYWIRHALHDSFLFSSAFDVRIERDGAGWPKTVELRGAGWGHGAGMCQIGALGMALLGHSHERILSHYFQDITIESYHV